MTRPHEGSPRSPDRHFLAGAARASAGAVIFALPMLMTMEMWHLGVTMGRGRLILLVVVSVPLLVGLSHVSGFEETFDVKEDIVDAFVAYAIGLSAAAIVLSLVGALERDMPLGEVTGKLVVQAVPASIGALLAQSQLGGQQGNGAAGEPRERSETEGAGERRRPSTYASQLFLMAIGALFLAFNVAPTDEVAIVAQSITPWQGLTILALSLVAMHAFVYGVEFRGQEQVPPGMSGWGVLLRFTITGYALVLAICAYLLWSFGRFDGTGGFECLMLTVVLGLPAAVGAAAARLIL